MFKLGRHGMVETEGAWLAIVALARESAQTEDWITYGLLKSYRSMGNSTEKTGIAIFKQLQLAYRPEAGMADTAPHERWKAR